jgi:hypothetical protein
VKMRWQNANYNVGKYTEIYCKYIEIHCNYIARYCKYFQTTNTTKYIEIHYQYNEI